MTDQSDYDRRRKAVGWARVWIAADERLGRETPQWVIDMVAEWEREHPVPA